MTNLLLIIDPQNDFIEGSLPVPGAVEAMNNLSQWIAENSATIGAIYITTDQHPINHSSFVEYGGIWPSHCVKYSEGSAIFPSLFHSLSNFSKTGNDIQIIEKGTKVDLEEYSAFHTLIPVVFEKVDRIYVCGIAGDVCVLNSINDLCKKGLGDKLVVLNECTASLDGGDKLLSFLAEKNIRCFVR